MTAQPQANLTTVEYANAVSLYMAGSVLDVDMKINKLLIIKFGSLCVSDS